jgi:predicted ATPase
MTTGAGAAETALRNRLFSDLDDGEDVPENKKEVLGTVQQVLERTIVESEGNSLLIIGPRGCGKTWVMNSVFRTLQKDRRCKDNYIRVYLNGLVHTDDRLALLEIARQLNVDSDNEEPTSVRLQISALQ